MRVSISAPAREVLPRLDQPLLCDLLRRLPPEEFDLAMQTKVLCAGKLPGAEFYVACGGSAIATARGWGLPVAAYADAEDFRNAVHSMHGRFLMHRAAFGLMRRLPAYSASRPLTGKQAVASLLLGAVLVSGALVLPAHLTLAALSAAGGLFFLAVMALRLLSLLPSASRPAAPDPPELAAADLPVYSVLVPLFRETAVLPQLVRALTAMQYPVHKLDIKLVLEEDDLEMRRAVAAIALDRRFEVIVAPPGKPRTKPRALNYALQFCRGALVTIYDAEDIPEPDQLLKAARKFAGRPRSVACLQAQLSFYNPDENWLSRQFTAEYAVLFGLLLPALSSYRLPLPLGGTSNHFRTGILRDAGAWDPFNVTEDADLGVRLARSGYVTETLDSFTYEEATTHSGNWFRQRARWLKGFLLTWLVHMRSPLRLLRDLGPAGFWTVQAMTLGVFASALLYPAGVLLVVLFYVSGGLDRQGIGLAALALAAVNLLVFAAGHASSILLMRRAARRHAIACSWVTLVTVPFYWCMMSVAAWLALWQFATRPFHWNKTEHGLSKLQARVSPPPAGRTPARPRCWQPGEPQVALPHAWQATAKSRGLRQPHRV